MAWRPHRQPGQPIRIIFTGRERVERPFKPISRVQKLRLKFFSYLRADLVTALADSGPQCRNHIFRLRAEFHFHAAYSFFGDAVQRSAPTSVNRGRSVVLRIREQDWNAIRRLHCQEYAALAREERIALRRGISACIYWGGSVRAMNNVRMNLPHRDHSHFFGPDGAEKSRSVLQHAFALVPIRKAEIQYVLNLLPSIAKSLEFARATGPRAESVDQPVEPRERWCLKNSQSTRPARFP